MITLVALFKWTGQLPDEPTGLLEQFSEDDGEQMSYELAYPATSSLVDALRAKGVTCSDPGPEEFGWGVDFQSETKVVELFVSWTAMEFPPDNYISIQWHVCRTFTEWLLRKKIPSEIESEVQDMIHNALMSVAHVKDLQWLTDEQFAASYLRGEPLPDA